MNKKIIIFFCIINILFINLFTMAKEENDFWKKVDVYEESVTISENWEEIYWESPYMKNIYGDKEIITQKDTEFIKFKFKGTGVRWLGSVGKQRGKANVYLDGELVEEGISLYNKEEEIRILFEKIGLEKTEHLLKIEPTGKGEKEVYLPVITVDAFSYQPILEELVKDIKNYQKLVENIDIFIDKVPIKEKIITNYEPFRKVVKEAGKILLKNEFSKNEIMKYRNKIEKKMKPLEGEAMSILKNLDNRVYISNNKILNGYEEEVRLQGVNIPSLGWRVSGEHIYESFEVALDEWGANVIRLPVKARFWFGEGEEDFNSREDGGKGYRERVDKLIEMASKRNKYIILDLHKFYAPDNICLEFWKDAAQRYKNHPMVLFGIFNEPYGISWNVWKNGGEIRKPQNSSDIEVQNEEKTSDTFYSPGHQALVDVIRKQGANNIIIAAGLDWGFDLSGIASGYALEDTEEGLGIMYDSHVYPHKYQKNVEDHVSIIKDEYPILIGEFGFWHKDHRPDDHPWLEKGPQDPRKWFKEIFGWMERNNFHWTGWSFHPGAAPRMIEDWDFTPTEHWGKYAKEQLKNIK